MSKNAKSSRRAKPSKAAFQKPKRFTVQELLKRLQNGEPFFSLVQPLYLTHYITKADVVDIVEEGLKRARGNYKTLSRDWNVPTTAVAYKRFLNFLRKHELQVPFLPIRSLRMVHSAEPAEQEVGAAHPV